MTYMTTDKNRYRVYLTQYYKDEHTEMTYECETVNWLVAHVKQDMDALKMDKAAIWRDGDRIGMVYRPRYGDSVLFNFSPTGETVTLKADGSLPDDMGEIRLSDYEPIRFAPRQRIDCTSYSVGMTDGHYVIGLENPGAFANYECSKAEGIEFAKFLLDYFRRH